MNNTQNKEFEKMINESGDLLTFLLCTPYSSAPCFNYYNELTEEFFFENLFLLSEKAKSDEEEIRNYIECAKDPNRAFLITGYKGCGKTTFVNYLMYKSGYRSRLINIEEINTTRNPVKEKLVLYLYELIAEDGDTNFSVLNMMFTIFFDRYNQRIIDKKIDSCNKIKSFFIQCENLITCPGKQIFLYSENVKMSLNELEIEQLLMLIIFWDISYSMVYKVDQRCFIIFDNLDAIFETDCINEFMEKFLAFYNSTSRLFSYLRHDLINKPHYNIFQNYYFFFSMRETTKAKINEHFNDTTINHYKYLDHSLTFPKDEIIEKRVNYIKDNKNIINGTFSRDMEIISKIIKDDYNKNNIFPLFNNDYRTSIMVLVEMCNYGRDDISQYENLISSPNDFIRFGARGIVFRQIIDIFNRNHYLNRIKASEVSCKKQQKIKSAINISRLLLTYLRQTKPGYYINGNINYDSTVSLYDIFEDFCQICDLELVVDSIWGMFDLRNATYWNHLITFDVLKEVSREELLKQKNDFCAGNKNYNNYAKLRITCGGQVYLNTLLTHFEYYASRIFGNSKHALFCNESFEIANSKYVFHDIVEQVMKEVRQCCSRIYNFHRTVFEDEMQYTNQEYLNSMFAYTKYDEEDTQNRAMFHGERIIHSHISYLDAFRKYSIMKLSDTIQKAEVNKILIGFIQNYIDFFGMDTSNQITYYSEQTPPLVNSYKKCINAISNKEFRDFSTSIDYKTGRSL